MIKKKKNRKKTALRMLLILVVFNVPAFFLYAQETSDTTQQTEEEEFTNGIDSADNYFLLHNEGAKPSEVYVRKLPDSATNALRNDDAFWYANEEWNRPQQVINSPGGATSQSIFRMAFFRNLMWIIIICSFIAVLIWYLSISNAGIFRRRSMMLTKDSDEIIYDDIFEIDYSKEINKAISGGNNRVAVRLLFLQLLKKLSERSVIQYSQDRTNLDYLVQLRQSSYYNDFFRLARNYEYVWYGKFDMNKEIFYSIKNDFEKFNQRLA